MNRNFYWQNKFQNYFSHKIFSWQNKCLIGVSRLIKKLMWYETRNCLRPYNNLKATKQMQVYFRTYRKLLLLSKHRINSVVCSFLQLLGCWSYEEEINCEYALFRRQNMVCSSPLSIATPPPAYQLSVVFSPPHPTTVPPLSIMHLRVF